MASRVIVTSPPAKPTSQESYDAGFRDGRRAERDKQSADARVGHTKRARTHRNWFGAGFAVCAASGAVLHFELMAKVPPYLWWFFLGAATCFSLFHLWKWDYHYTKS